MAYSAEEETIAINIITQIDNEYFRQINEFDTLCNILGIQPGKDTSSADPVSIKALIVMLYSHYEGFIKYASLRYVELINRLNLDASIVKAQFSAASLNSVFKDVEQNQAKSDFFRNSLPDDSALHRLYRRSNLVEHLQDLWNKKVAVDETYIDTESNLKYDILCRTLYSIGLDPRLMEPYQSEIGLLLRFRNPIAHGDLLSENTYLSWYPKIEVAARTVIREFRQNVKDAIISQKYLHDVA
jgi:hypothetical protein